MNRQTMGSKRFALVLVALSAGLAGCSNSDDHRGTPPPMSGNVGVEGVVSDGPVAGGTIYVLTRQQMLDVVRAVAGGEALPDALEASGGTSFARDPADEGRFDIDVTAGLARQYVFLVLDATDAEDLEFGDTPPHLYSIAFLGPGGARQRANISLHTSIIVRQILSQLDPDGDGVPLTDSEIRGLLEASGLSTIDALGKDSVGRPLFGARSPLTDDDDARVHHASSELGLRLRELAASAGLSLDEILAALAADAADGHIDGLIPAILGASAELEALAELLRDHDVREEDDYQMLAVGPCSSSAVAMRRACSADVVDDAFLHRAVCADIADEAARLECLAEAEITDEENAEECDAVFEARLAVCESIMDAPHDPLFGAMLAASFVDPTAIGDTVEPNPYFPLAAGNRWVYESEDETIVVNVLEETKLIDGITCVTVNDVVTEDGVVIEDTDDWYAQDLDGNVWYCGEIAQNFELFEGDDPELPELVDIDGSWKHGRDGAEAGMLLPFAPTVGTTIRQEVLYGEAEDVIEILSLMASETSPAASCTDTCLQTRDFTALEPDVEEHKYYAPDVGMIVEVDPESGERLELVEFTPGG